jgi:hypothetical protein
VYKLVFDLIIPVYQTSKQVKQKMGEMQQKMNEQARQQQQQQAQTTERASATKPPKEDYIEFEEIK